jgi:hypothetical protein
MKTSRRLLFGTFAVLLAAPVVLVAYSRVSGTGFRELPPPERTAPAEIAALRDFTAIEITGDFELEIVRADFFAVEYTPVAEDRGNFNAAVRNGRLEIEGFGNRTNVAQGSVRISMPDLDALNVGYVPIMAVRNFQGDTFEASINYTDELTLENNQFDSFELELTQAGIVEMRGNSFGSSRISHFNTTITTD